MKSVITTLLLLFILNIHLIQGQNNFRDSQKELKNEKQLESIDPSLVETFKEGTLAMDANKLVLADSLYTIVYNKAPGFDPVIRRLGTIGINLGKTREGIALCKKAVEINNSAYNLMSLAYCYLFSKDSANLNTAYSLLIKAQQLPDGNDKDILGLIAQISLQQNNIFELRKTTDSMIQLYPNEMQTHYYSAVIFAYDKEWFKAKKEILLAQKKGLQNDIVDQFLDSGVNSKVTQLNFAIYFGLIIGCWVLGLLLLFLVGKLLSHLTMLSIETQAKHPSQIKAGGWLRSCYKFLINTGGVYYYLSLPIILVLVVLLVIAAFYLFLIMGHMPYQLMLILIIGSAGTIYNMIRSLLVKITYTDPGRELQKNEAPGLYAMTKEVAHIMGTRAIDEIRITHGTDLAVYEQGSRKEKQHDKARRVLILGIGILKDFKQNDFKAVLAHEYGHFSHRDTAGGEVALRVQNDMNKYVYALYMANQATFWNIAFHFLKLYSFIFRRISHGATRLQEVMADRVAALTFGTIAFENGLTYVIRREIEFTKCANAEIDDAVESKRLLRNLYELNYYNAGTIDDELTKVLQQKTSENDTHPSPVDRFRFIAGINVKNNYQDSPLVTDLFDNWGALTNEMTQKIDKKVERDEY